MLELPLELSLITSLYIMTHY